MLLMLLPSRFTTTPSDIGVRFNGTALQMLSHGKIICFCKSIRSTSAVSSTDWVTDTINTIDKLCKLTHTSAACVLCSSLIRFWLFQMRYTSAMARKPIEITFVFSPPPRLLNYFSAVCEDFGERDVRGRRRWWRRPTGCAVEAEERAQHPHWVKEEESVRHYHCGRRVCLRSAR